MSGGTRDVAASSRALLDGWATITDVLTVHGRRIANEGYLRTATEQRSFLELTKLVGYRPRPGVAASVFLAYTLEPNAHVHLEAKSNVRSIPRPGEMAQTFETVEALDARGCWNTLRIAARPRMLAQGSRTDPSDPAADLSDAEHAGTTALELDAVYDGLTPGRWVVVSGTRADLPGVPGAELATILHIEHRGNPESAADPRRTFITLTRGLEHRYLRAGFTLAGNVVRATHGEHRTETLGSGDATQARQSFALGAAPLTFVAAPTRSGVRSTLSLRVNGIRWSEADDLAAAGPSDRVYTTATSAAVTVVTFGDGVHGARLPTGENNVAASYRVGLGAAGNLGAQTLLVPIAAPPGVEAVSNPLPAGGGADADSLDDVRRNAPVSLLGLTRLIALDDYAQVARRFAGVAKATAARIGFAPADTIYVTIAATDDAPIDFPGSLAANGGNCAANFRAALRRLADPRQAFAIGTVDRVPLRISASIDLAPGAGWETVAAAIRSALRETFGFRARDFGQAALKNEAIAALARVPGVADVEIECFTKVSVAPPPRSDFAWQPVVDEVVVPLPARRTGTTIAPAQIVMLDPSIRDTVLLRDAAGGPR